MATVALAIPTHNETVTLGTLLGTVLATRKHDLQIIPQACSLLAHGFNQQWAHAVCSGADWFAMLHADIGPEAYWIDTLIERAEAHQADILSACVLIKAPPGAAEAGETSTAWLPPIGRPGEPRRLALDHLAQLPLVFDRFDVSSLMDAQGLLGINTGCFVARLGGAPWTRQVSFQIDSRIDWTTDPPTCKVFSEDWRFSRDAANLGARVCGTTLNLDHLGPFKWTIRPGHFLTTTHNEPPHGQPRETVEAAAAPGP